MRETLDKILRSSIVQTRGRSEAKRESRKEAQTVLVTAMSGVNARPYLKAFVSFAKERGKVGFLSIGDKVVEVAQTHDPSVTPENILKREEKELDEWRAEAFTDILVERGKYEHCIILGHTCFYDRETNRILPAFNLKLEAEMMNALDPTVFVTLSDSLLPIKKEQFRNAHWREQNLSLREISIWREEETFFTRVLAKLMARPHFIIPIAEPFQTLDRLIFDRSRVRKFYLSYPITQVLDREDRRVIFEKKDYVRDKLREQYVVIDPFDLKDSEVYKCLRKGINFPYKLEATEVVCKIQNGQAGQEFEGLSVEKIAGEDDTFIVVGTEVKFTKSELEELGAYNSQQIVERDYQLIDQSDAVVVYYPILEVSPGVLSETIYAHSYGRDTFIWWTPSVSPFLQRYATRVFKEEAPTKLLEYLLMEYARRS